MHHLTGMAAHTGAALVVVTHDVNVAAWCGAVVRVRDGRVVERLASANGTGVASGSTDATGQVTA
jgi:putative ABC transport system ATP-binding protein